MMPGQQQRLLFSWVEARQVEYIKGICIPPIWFGLAFLQIRLPCSDPTTDDLNSRVEFAGGTYSLEAGMNAESF